jgi:hypothetical protein
VLVDDLTQPVGVADVQLCSPHRNVRIERTLRKQAAKVLARSGETRQLSGSGRNDENVARAAG